jgi:hypothetical protein
MKRSHADSSRLVQAARILREARSRHAVAYPRLALRFLDCNLRRKFSLREIRKLDLLDPSYTTRVLDGLLSKHDALQLQDRLNPHSARSSTLDKREFHRRCLANDLPTPRCFGSIDAMPADASSATRTRLAEDATAVLARADVDELILKPALGAHGEGVALLRRHQDRWIDQNGAAHLPAELPAWLGHRGWHEAFVVQERLFGHPELAALSGTRSLQTVRMISYLTTSDLPVIVGCQLRIVGNDALIDNFANGTLGNLVGDIPRASGILTTVFVASPDGSTSFVDRHPRTGVTFRGFAVPFWEEACALVRRAALAFRPLRTIGWDVAITGSGPVLIEGNERWDPPQRGEVAGEILEAVRADRALPHRRAKSAVRPTAA